MKKKKREEDFEDLEFEDDELVDEDENAVDDKKQHASTDDLDIDDDLREAIVKIVNAETHDIRREQKKMAKQLKIIDKNMSTQSALIEKLDANSNAMLKAIARIDGSAIATTDDVIDAVEAEQTNEKRGVIGSTLGAIGGVAHACVDTVAFVLESTIDLVTLGNARK